MSEHVSAQLRQLVRKRFSDCCAYCRTAEGLSVALFEVDHIVPRSAGGETVFDNLCLACPTCNRYKVHRTVAVDPNTSKEVSLFHPHRDVWTDHFAWNRDATELVGVTPIGRATIVALRMNRPPLVRVRRMWVAMGEHPPGLEER